MNTQQQTLNKRVLDVLNKCWEYNGGMCGEEFSQEKASIELEKIFLSEIEKSFDAGRVHEYEIHFGANPPLTENKEQYINQLNNIQ